MLVITNCTSMVKQTNPESFVNMICVTQMLFTTVVNSEQTIADLVLAARIRKV